MAFIKWRNLSLLLALFVFNTAEAGNPTWTFTPLTPTILSVPSNDMTIVQYQVSNQSTRTHTLTMQSIPGITQLTTGLGVCGNPFILTKNASCTLSLQVNGSQLTQSVSDGPIVCEEGSILQCYRPALANILQITQAPPITNATITVTNSPLTLTTTGPTGTLTINNMSLIVAATNITSNFAGTALDGNVTETGNTCSSVAPLASCMLTYTPGSTVVPQTNFTIQGSNTNAVTAAIKIDTGVTVTNVSTSSGPASSGPASGGTGVTLTGVGFTGATGVSFGGTAATGFNVVNSTTVTAVTPSHAAGVVNVVVTTPTGSGTKTNGYTYLTTVVGQPAYGGIIACLDTTSSNYLVAATVDNSASITWGGYGTPTNATSNINGAANTATIVSVLGAGGASYAARLCSDYEIDSLGKNPCEPGNTCYNDWFLPAGKNATPTGQLHCLRTNRVAIGGFDSSLSGSYYWSSTEDNANGAWVQNFNSGTQSGDIKFGNRRVRCVRAFTP